MSEPECMILCILGTNLICNALITGKITQIERCKTDTLYDLLYRMVYPAMGIGIGTMIAYLIKWI